MNKKLKRMAVVGATVLMTASSVGFSNAMQVKKSCDLNLTGKMYVCINGKRFKLDLSCASIFDTLKWFNKNNCPNKFPSIPIIIGIDTPHITYIIAISLPSIAKAIIIAAGFIIGVATRNDKVGPKYAPVLYILKARGRTPQLHIGNKQPDIVVFIRDDIFLFPICF